MCRHYDGAKSDESGDMLLDKGWVSSCQSIHHSCAHRVTNVSQFFVLRRRRFLNVLNHRDKVIARVMTNVEVKELFSVSHGVQRLMLA